MKPETQEVVLEKLRAVPMGSLEVQVHALQEHVGTSLQEHIQTALSGKGIMEIYPLYPAIELSFFTICGTSPMFHHKALPDKLEINYCHQGRIGWDLQDVGSIYLGPGDCSLHPMECCANSVMNLPLGYYEGITICVDLKKLSEATPELLSGTGITGKSLYEKFFHKEAFLTLPANEQVGGIFEALYTAPKQFQFAYYKLKVLELLLQLSHMPLPSEPQVSGCQSDQVETIRAMHDYMMDHLDQRLTIDELSRQYHINTTTLKSVFKAVYGTSIAAHIKEHRMENAARALIGTRNSVASIAAAVGYENQSKFTAAFKETYGILPTEYRKRQNR
jgi:AraC-like DNA-binding protein